MGGGYTFQLVIAISKRVNVSHVDKTVTDFGGIYTDITPPRPYRYAPDKQISWYWR